MMIDVSITHRLPPARGAGGKGFKIDVSFATEDRTLVLFGHSGSGKTLTLQAIAGLMHPREGRIVINGTTLLDTAAGIDMPARDRGIGYVFQDYALFPHLSVRKNVEFGLGAGRRASVAGQSGAGKGSGADGASGKQRVDELLELFEIDHVAHNLPGNISGGQRQRTALARALATNPRALLLDEPFSALDPLLRVRMRKEFTRLFAHFDIPAIIITHDPDDVDAFADTLVLYEDGRIRHRLNFRELRAEGRPALGLLMALMN
ncbi:ATP-binding cassette domain-containing protein [Nitratidesulfovibrio sp. SRB-5]|uniref:ATP-binding cassette domain-containing protein n=1 Tax=Nitratidesulfovibrio sp. SRB-5 TaxID=2872636 RepID=UPI001CBA6165|nr:ATP-binding cassette domain-containing protein [Nitratidesulfovibrio sp. SRB-5]